MTSPSTTSAPPPPHRRADPVTPASPRRAVGVATGASIAEAGVPAAHRQLQGARRAQRADAADAEQQRRGVIAASAGNHALGLAYHGSLLGIPATVVMPRFAPLIKVANCRQLGANVHAARRNASPRRAPDADELAPSASRLTYVHGYDDPAIIAGQGTVGLEMLEQVPDLDAIVVPIGGGGLIAGIALAVKSLRPDVEIIGVEPEHAACFTAALAAGEPADIALTPDAGRRPGGGADRRRAVRDRARSASTASSPSTKTAIALAILRLVELEKSVVEGAGAARAGRLHGRQAAASSRASRSCWCCRAATSTSTCSTA